MSEFRTPTAWRVADMHVGQIIYMPPHRSVDPVTRKAGAEYQKFRVAAIVDGAATLEIYRGSEPADMPPVESTE